MYINGLKNYFDKYDLLKKPNFKCQTCPDLHGKNCNKCRHSLSFKLIFKQK